MKVSNIILKKYAEIVSKAHNIKFLEIMKSFILNVENAKSLVGKRITWFAEAYDWNRPYGGEAIIREVSEGEKRNPYGTIHNTLKCETISGDDLRYAFVDRYGLKEDSDGCWRCAEDAPRVYCYSDSYREVEIISMENED